MRSMDAARSDDWNLAFSPRAEDQFASLEGDVQYRIVSKLVDVVTSECREPETFLEPLMRSPFQKLRVGDDRRGCRTVRDDRLLPI
jgi:mRNA interferase RelE/StbE